MKTIALLSFAMLVLTAGGIGLRPGPGTVRGAIPGGEAAGPATTARNPASAAWPVLKAYDQEHIDRIAMPIGGIGTGTVSLGGAGNLRDFEIMNRPAKGFSGGTGGNNAPFFAVRCQAEGAGAVTRGLMGPAPADEYECADGQLADSHGIPRFRRCRFDAAYPFGQVHLSDDDVPVDVTVQAFNPLVPGDVDSSSIPAAVLRYVFTNKTDRNVALSVCGTFTNFIGMDGSQTNRDWRWEAIPCGAKANRNRFRAGAHVQGIEMTSEGVDPAAEAFGTMALATLAGEETSYRTSLSSAGWGNDLLDFWDDFSSDGVLAHVGMGTEGAAAGAAPEPSPSDQGDMPRAALAVRRDLPPGGTAAVTFLFTWHFPNRFAWSASRAGNYYTTQYAGAWDAAEETAACLPELERRTVAFVRAFLTADLPDVVKEAALFNLSTLRSQTCFRIEDGRFFGWEGCMDHVGSCFGSCTHVWNYEQATAFLFGSLATAMREVEFGLATDDGGLMSFRVRLPLENARAFGKAAADGQMGCIMKMYRDWQLSGDGGLLRSLWPRVRKAVEFCWIDGGWDGDADGVMEGCQHNTMDVEYFGPNPQMQIWYLGALKAAEKMAGYVGDAEFAAACRARFDAGRAWTDEHLFNGEHYIQEIRPPAAWSDVAPCLVVGMGAGDPSDPDFQLGEGCLVDQLVGQYMAHVCGLGYLIDPGHAAAALQSIMKYNFKPSLHGHFNNMRSFALGGEAGLLMASFPRGRPAVPFPYFSEVMTGFEYTAAAGMIFEGQTENAVACIRAIRDRYDGRKRSPFDEAECGHHYARAMASWAAHLALTGFHYSAVDGSIAFARRDGTFFWSNGYSFGLATQQPAAAGAASVRIQVIEGSLALRELILNGFGRAVLDPPAAIAAGESLDFTVPHNDPAAGLPARNAGD